MVGLSLLRTRTLPFTDKKFIRSKIAFSRALRTVRIPGCFRIAGNHKTVKKSDFLVDFGRFLGPEGRFWTSWTEKSTQIDQKIGFFDGFMIPRDSEAPGIRTVRGASENAIFGRKKFSVRKGEGPCP